MPDSRKKYTSIHTNRTMMFAELEKVMDYSIEADTYQEALARNITGKKSESGAKITSGKLKKLYSFDMQDALFMAFKFFWKLVETQHRSLIAFIYAVNHDDLLAQSSNVICKYEFENQVPVVAFEENIEKYYPKLFSPKTRKSTSQNIASSWKQAGFIEGKIKNIRVQPDINYQVACFAFFLAYLKGDRGEFIWKNTGVKALCLSESKLRELAVECKQRDLMEYQSAGEVTTISFNQLMKKTGIDAI